MTKQKPNSKKFLIIIPLLALIVALATFGIIRLVNQNNQPAPEDTNNSSEPAPEPEPEPEPAKPALINLQPVVDKWATNLSRGSAGVLIYDLDNETTVASYHADDVLPTESLYKLFVVYEGYRRVEDGRINKDSVISAGRSWSKCLDLAIRESNSPCAEAMRAALGTENLNAIIKNDYAIQHTNVASLTSTPSDIADIMKLFYEHSEFSETTWAAIQDSMLNQPPSQGLCAGGICDWRRGLPKGFTSGEAKVYNKVGWYYSGANNIWRSYHDAAIVEFPALNRHYIVVVMTRNSYLKDVVSLGTEIEKAILTQS